MLVGIPNLAENDRFSSYRDLVLSRIEEALVGMDHVVFVTPPADLKGIPGIVDRSNLLIERCISEGFDYLWIVQADVEVPLTSFENLLGLDVDLAFGVVPRHDDKEALVCGYLDACRKVWYLPRQAVVDHVLAGRVFASGCVLIKRNVLDGGVRFRYERGIGEDVLFAYEVQEAGFVAKVDGRVLCGHLPEWPLPSELKEKVVYGAGK